MCFVYVFCVCALYVCVLCVCVCGSSVEKGKLLPCSQISANGLKETATPVEDHRTQSGRQGLCAVLLLSLPGGHRWGPPYVLSLTKVWQTQFTYYTNLLKGIDSM